MEERPNLIEPQPSRLPGGIVAGIILVLIGLMALLGQFILLPPTAWFIGLGILFLAWGLVTRKSGLIIPGGVLCGIFAGVTLITGPLAGVSGPARGGIFLAAFACGWILISLLSVYTEGPRKWWSWPLYPGGILGVIALSLLAGEAGLRILEIAGYIWPVILIVLGLALVLRRPHK